MYRNRALGRTLARLHTVQRKVNRHNSDSSYSVSSNESSSNESFDGMSISESHESFTEDDRGRELERPVARSQTHARGTKRAADRANEYTADSKRQRTRENTDVVVNTMPPEYNPVIANVDFRLEPLYAGGTEHGVAHGTVHDTTINNGYIVQKYSVLDVPTDAPYTAMVSLANGVVMPVIAIINGLFYTRAKMHEGRRVYTCSGTNWIHDSTRASTRTYAPVQQEALAHTPYTYFLITTVGDTVREFTAPLKVVNARVWCALPADKHKYALSKFYFYRAWLLASAYDVASNGARNNIASDGNERAISTTNNDTPTVVFIDGAFNKFCTVPAPADILRDPAPNVVTQDNADYVYSMYPANTTDDRKTMLIIKAADCAYWYERSSTCTDTLLLTPWVFIEKITGMINLRVGRHDLVVCKAIDMSVAESADAATDKPRVQPCQRVYGRWPLTRLREVPEADYPVVNNNSLLWKESGRRIDFNLRRCAGCGRLMDLQENDSTRKCAECAECVIR